MRFLIYEFKRLFSKRALTGLLIMAPIVVLITFTSVFMPMFYTGQGFHFNLALLNEDDGDEINLLVSQYLNSVAMANLVDIYPVDSLDKGIELIEGGQVSVLMHITSDFYKKLIDEERAEFILYARESHSLDLELMSMIFSSSLDLLGKNQNIVDATRLMLIDKGIDRDLAHDFIDSEARKVNGKYLSRRTILGTDKNLTHFADHFSLEFIIVAIYSLFASLSILPLIYFTARDVNGKILKRGLLSGIGIAKFYISRLISGLSLLFMVQLTIIPFLYFFEGMGEFIFRDYHSSILAIVLSIFLFSLCLSALAILIGSFSKDVSASLWKGFFIVIFMSALSGILIKDAALPGFLAFLGRLMPQSFGMKLYRNSMFSFKPKDFIKDFLSLSAWTILFVSMGVLRLRRGEA